MKVALLGPEAPDQGGIVHFHERLLRELAGRPDTTADGYAWSKLYPAFLLRRVGRERNDRTGFRAAASPRRRILSYTNPMTWWRLIRRIRRNRYDGFITHWMHPVHAPVLVALFAALRLLTKARIMIIAHNVLPHERFFGDRALTCLTFKAAHKVVVHGGEQADLARRHGVSEKKLIRGYHPLYDQFAPSQESAASIRRSLGLREKVVLFFGYIRPYKGLDVLLDAFVKFASSRPDVSLLIVGESFYKSRRQGGVEKPLDCFPVPETISSRVVWINRYVDDHEVGRFFAAADVLVAPYLAVSQSGPLQIAYAFGKPVIASDLQAFVEAVSPGESGLLFRAGDANDLARVLTRFYDSPVAADSVLRFGRRFSWEAYVDKLLMECMCKEAISA